MSHGDEVHDHRLTFIAAIAFLTLLILYITIGTYMEDKHPPVGHETGVIIIIGIAFSLVSYINDKDAVYLNWS